MQPTDLDGAVIRQSLNWIADVAPRLNVSIELVDAHDAAVLPIASTREAAGFRMLLTGGEPALRSAIASVKHSTSRVVLVVDGMQVLCAGLSSGVLLVARPLLRGGSLDQCPEDLEAISTWLTGTIEASLAQPDAISVEHYRIVSFQRILREATSRGSVRSVIGAFVEALSVWDDVRVRCYIAGALGGFFQYGASLAALPSSLPTELDEGIVPPDGHLALLSRADLESLGLATEPGDTLVLHLLVGDTTWLLFFSGMMDDRVHVRLRVYSDMLRESLLEVLTTTTSRLVAEVSRPQRPMNESIEVAAEVALGQISAAVGGHPGALAVTTPAGGTLLAVGDAAVLASMQQIRRNRLVVRSADAVSVMTTVFEREQAPFTSFDREIVQAGVAVVHRWVQAALHRPDVSERRRRARPVDTLFDQLASEAVAAGRPASVIVVAVDPGRVRQGMLSSWVGRIRGQLRGGDFAGALSEGEIAVLLCGASAPHAAIVSARLTQMFRGDDTGVFARFAIGVTTRSPDSRANGSIVAAARASAAFAR